MAGWFDCLIWFLVDGSVELVCLFGYLVCLVWSDWLISLGLVWLMGWLDWFGWLIWFSWLVGFCLVSFCFFSLFSLFDWLAG